MPKEGMATPLADELKSLLVQDLHQAGGRDDRQLAHVAIWSWCTPMKVFCSGRSSLAPSQSLMASSILLSNSGRVRAWVWQPFKEGTDPMYQPSSSRSMR